MLGRFWTLITVPSHSREPVGYRRTPFVFSAQKTWCSNPMNYSVQHTITSPHVSYFLFLSVTHHNNPPVSIDKPLSRYMYVFGKYKRFLTPKHGMCLSPVHAVWP